MSSMHLWLTMIQQTPWVTSLCLCLQVAHGYLQHVSFVTGGEVDDYGAWIELECLLETYNLSLPENRDSKNHTSLHNTLYLHAM